MISILNELLLFSCLAALITWIARGRDYPHLIFTLRVRSCIA
jgi:hypothetical protein